MPGPDCIPNTFPRRYAETVAKFLALTFKSSIQSATLPSDFKIAHIIPIPQRSGPLRPISMLSSACKLLEHVVATFVIQFLNTHRIISPFQHRFCKGYLTTTQLQFFTTFLQFLIRQDRLNSFFHISVRHLIASHMTN